jgi:hypothetical protein
VSERRERRPQQQREAAHERLELEEAAEVAVEQRLHRSRRVAGIVEPDARVEGERHAHAERGERTESPRCACPHGNLIGMSRARVERAGCHDPLP